LSETEKIFGFIAGAEWIWLILGVIVIVSIIAAVAKRKKKSVEIGMEDVGLTSNETQPKNEKPLKILKQRLAKGEITKEDYDELKKEFKNS